MVPLFEQFVSNFHLLQWHLMAGEAELTPPAALFAVQQRVGDVSF